LLRVICPRRWFDITARRGINTFASNPHQARNFATGYKIPSPVTDRVPQGQKEAEGLESLTVVEFAMIQAARVSAKGLCFIPLE